MAQEEIPLRGEAIVCLSSIDWDFIWQWQEIMLRLAKAGNPVLFIENTGVRTPGLRDLPRVFKRLSNWGKGVQGFREQAPNLIVLSPLLLPFPYSRVARWINARLLGRAIANWIAASKHNSPILWTCLPTPLVHDIVEELDPALVVYYCADHFAASSSSAKAIEASEKELFRNADLVFVSSRQIQARAELVREKAQLFPVAVDFEAFETSRTGNAAEPADIAAIPKPRFGYVGGLHRWVDQELLREAALKRPGYHFVLIGPEQTDLSLLKALPNVHLMGKRDHEDLPAYIGAFDAGLIPYRLAEYTASVYPAKLNEYFAMGIPVISTALAEVLAYNEAHGGPVRVAKDETQFISELDESLRAPAADRNARIDAARRNGWAGRLAEMSSLMRESLERKRSTPKIMSGLLRRLVRRYQTATLGGALAFAALWAVLSWTPLAWRLSEPMKLFAAPLSADAVVVIGGGAGETGLLGSGHDERASRAIELYLQGHAKKIVICSGEVQTFSEWEVMRAIALTKGVKDSDILIVSRGGGTQQMIMDAARLVRANRWKRILLVSSPYHMKRAVLVWGKHEPRLEVVPTPVRSSKFYGYYEGSSAWARTGPTWTQLRGLLKEASALAYYRYRGWI